MPQPHATPAPTLPLMHAAFVLAGLGTMLLGPILPLLALRWHLNDSHAGFLILAQFTGATLGGATLTRRLTRDILLALLAAALGMALFALAPGLPLACTGLLLGGFGIGRIIASINILAGNRYTLHRASALSWLNFSWSFGALLSPLSAAWLASRFPLPNLLTLFAAAFLAVAAAVALQLRTHSTETTTQTTNTIPSLTPRLFLYFATLLFIYGGLETCLSAWLTTYAVRDAATSLRLSQYIMVLLLLGLTAGRAIAGYLLKLVQDATLQRLALVLSALLTTALALTHTPPLIAILAILLGITLAPIFPATFAIVLAAKPPARQAGIILAASGIGAACFPALMGLISTHTGSLRNALVIPVAAALLMLLLTLIPHPSKTPTPI